MDRDETSGDLSLLPNHTAMCKSAANKREALKGLYWYGRLVGHLPASKPTLIDVCITFSKKFAATHLYLYNTNSMCVYVCLYVCICACVHACLCVKYRWPNCFFCEPLCGAIIVRDYTNFARRQIDSVIALESSTSARYFHRQVMYIRTSH